MIRRAATTVTTRVSCRDCRSALPERGGQLVGFCEACRLLQRRHPGKDLETLRNGRTEVVPQERRVRDWRWRDDARCAGAPPDLFFRVPKPGSAAMPQEITQAAAVFCQGCPVVVQCGAEADEHRYVGLWGGAFRRMVGGSGPRHYRVRDLLDADRPERRA